MKNARLNSVKTNILSSKIYDLKKKALKTKWLGYRYMIKMSFKMLYFSPLPLYIANIAWADITPPPPVIDSKNPTNTDTKKAIDPSIRSIKLESITTTANKYEAELSSVNSNVSIVNEKQLQNANVKITNELDMMFSGLMMQTYGASAFPMMTLRGISSPDIYSTTLNLYIDGIPQTQNFMIQALGDVEQVELLRGPQGTLYGENSQAGIISIHTKNPMKGNYANFSLTGSRLYEDLNAYIGHNLIKDVLWIKANVRYIHDNGFITQLREGSQKTLNTADNVLGGITLYYAPTQNLLATLSYNFNITPNDKKAFYLTKTQYENEYKINANALAVDNFGTCNGNSQSMCINETTLGSPNAVYNYNPYQRSNAHASALKLEYSFLDSVLTSVSALNYAHTLNNQYPIVQTDGGKDSGYFYDNVQFVEETRLDSDYDNGVRSSIGIYYKYLLTNNGMRGYLSGNDGFTPFGFRANWNTKETVNTIALFSDGKIPIGDNFDIGLGARYQYYFASVDSPLSPGRYLSNPYSNSKGWHIFNPRLSFGYNLNANAKFYIAATQSTKAGGFAKFPYADRDTIPYNPEQIYSVELGSHLKFWDLRANIATYYMYIQDRQTYAGNNLAQSIVNVGDAFSVGMEFDLGYYSDRFSATFGGNIGISQYTNGDKNKGQVVIQGSPALFDVRGYRLKYSPLVSLVANIDYQILQKGNHRFYTGGNARFISEYYYDDLIHTADLTQSSYIVLDLNMRYVYKNMTIKLFGQNIANARYANYARNFGGLQTYYIPANPWNLGVQISYDNL